MVSEAQAGQVTPTGRVPWPPATASLLPALAKPLQAWVSGTIIPCASNTFPLVICLIISRNKSSLYLLHPQVKATGSAGNL